MHFDPNFYEYLRVDLMVATVQCASCMTLVRLDNPKS